jgi:antitoxin MazE
MKAKLVSIGNSRGIRLPKSVIQQYAFGDDVELELKEDHVVIRSAKPPRAGWDAAFARQTTTKADGLLDADAVHAETEWERTEWEW